MTDPAFRGIWGFEVVPGGLVGGGLFSTVRLEDDESVVDSVLASRQGPGWFDTSGYLTITDRRIIFTPYRWPVIGRARVIRYSDIDGVRASRKHNPGHLASFVVDSLVIELRGAHAETFLPVMPAEELATLIRGRLAP